MDMSLDRKEQVIKLTEFWTSVKQEKPVLWQEAKKY